METHTGVVEHRLTVRGHVVMSGAASLGADVLPGGHLEVSGVVGPVHVQDGGRFSLSGLMADELSVELDGEARIAGVFQGALIDAPEGVLVAEGSLIHVDGEPVLVTQGELTPAPEHIEHLKVTRGPWYRWWGDAMLHSVKGGA